MQHALAHCGVNFAEVVTTARTGLNKNGTRSIGHGAQLLEAPRELHPALEPQRAPGPKPPGKETISALVLAVLRANRDKSFDIDELLAATSYKGSRDAFGMTLSTMYRKGVIKRPQRGRYTV